MNIFGLLLLFYMILPGFFAHTHFSTNDIIKKSTINLIWINKEKPKPENKDETYVIPEPYIRQIAKSFPEAKEKVYSFNRIFLWANLNPGIKINIWYDGTTVADDAVLNTMRQLKILGIENQVALIEINVRLSEFAVLFAKDLPLYFRVDILKILATYIWLNEATIRGEVAFFIFVDFSIDPQRLHNLLVGKPTEELNKFGILVGETEKASYENSFHVIGNNKPNLLAALLGAIINLNLVRLELIAPKSLKEQAVYADYVGILPVFLALEGEATIGEKIRIPWEQRTSLDETFSLKPLTKEEVKSMLSVEALRPLGPGEKRRTPLFDHDNGGLSTSYAYQLNDSLKERFKSKYARLPTRVCVSKTSKINE